MRRTTVVVDVDAVRGGMDSDHLGALGLEGRRSGHIGGAVGTVDDDFDGLETDRATQARHKMSDVVLHQSWIVANPSHVGSGRSWSCAVACGGGHPSLDRVLQLITQFGSAPREKFDPV